MKKQKGKSQKASGGKKKDDTKDDKEAESSSVGGTAEQAEGSTENLGSAADGAEDGQSPSHPEHKRDAEEENPAKDSSKTAAKPPHNRQPSLSLQSKIRSSSFRRTSISQGPISPNGTKSPELPVLTPDGDSVNSIYRKQAARLDELEKENRRLAKESQEAVRRWRQTEEELEELREASGEVAELKSRAQQAEAQMEEHNKLVCFYPSSITEVSELWS